MTDDLIVRLRKLVAIAAKDPWVGQTFTAVDTLLIEAADVIERLTHGIERLRVGSDAMRAEIERLTAEIVDLHAALNEYEYRKTTADD